MTTCKNPYCGKVLPHGWLLCKPCLRQLPKDWREEILFGRLDDAEKERWFVVLSEFFRKFVGALPTGYPQKKKKRKKFGPNSYRNRRKPKWMEVMAKDLSGS